MFDVNFWRAQFPMLQQTVHGKPLVYLDNAGSTQKPQSVLDAMTHFYQCDYSNVNRGVHQLSARATEACEAVRDQVRDFIGAAYREEIIFVPGTTAAINLVAQSFGQYAMTAGDEVIITAMEHHANIVPWQLLKANMGIVVKVLPMQANGELCWDQLPNLIGPRTKLLAMGHVSNVLGTIHPVKAMVALAHKQGVKVLLDGAQAVPHMAVNVQELNCDFYAFSGHKMYGPTGIGVLYGKRDLLQAMPPVLGGGNMIATVNFEHSTYKASPDRFEAGTPPIAEIIGLGAAVDFLQRVGVADIAAHEQRLLNHALQGLTALDACTIHGNPLHRAAVISLAFAGVHAHDVATILDTHGVAVRAGHHCAMPLMNEMGVAATTRVSFGLYNTLAEVEVFLEAMQAVREVFV